MAERNSSWTGRAPRTMRGAFGPYTSDNLGDREVPRSQRILTWLYAVAVCAMLALLIVSGATS